MKTSDSVFQHALSRLLTEIFDGPPGNEAYLLNPGDPGLLRQLESIDAQVITGWPPMRCGPGAASIARI